MCLQAKQRRKDRKEKDKEPEEKCSQLEQESFQQQPAVLRPKERLQKESEILLLNPADTEKEEHDLSGLDTVVDVVGTLGLAMEDGDNDHTGWERGAGSYGQSGMEVAGFSGAVLEEGLAQNGKDELKHQASALDDSSSTCSSDSLPSVRPSLNDSFDSQHSMTDQNHTSSRFVSSSCAVGYLQNVILWLNSRFWRRLILLIVLLMLFFFLLCFSHLGSALGILLLLVSVTNPKCLQWIYC